MATLYSTPKRLKIGGHKMGDINIGLLIAVVAIAVITTITTNIITKQSKKDKQQPHSS